MVNFSLSTKKLPTIGNFCWKAISNLWSQARDSWTKSASSPPNLLETDQNHLKTFYRIIWKISILYLQNTKPFWNLSESFEKYQFYFSEILHLHNWKWHVQYRYKKPPLYDVWLIWNSFLLLRNKYWCSSYFSTKNWLTKIYRTLMWCQYMSKC